MVNTGLCSTALIIGHDGAVWTKSLEAKITREEAQRLVNGFNDPGALFISGTNIGGRHFVIVRANSRTVIGSASKSGFVAVKTSQAVLVGVYSVAAVTIL